MSPPSRIRRRERRVAKQKPFKGFAMMLLRRLSKRLFGRNVFRRWTDSPRHLPGTKPNRSFSEIAPQ